MGDLNPALMQECWANCGKSKIHRTYAQVTEKRRRISEAVATFAQRLAEKERQRLAAGYREGRIRAASRQRRTQRNNGFRELLRKS